MQHNASEQNIFFALKFSPSKHFITWFTWVWADH